jgi:8-oxo-dGTP diphosphatase
MVRRAASEDYGGEWAFPGGKLNPGESAEDACWRECAEEVGYRLGDVGKRMMRRVKDGVDAVTFVVDIPDEFTPQLNAEHEAWQWVNPKDVVAKAKGAAGTQVPADDADAKFLAELQEPQ